MGPAWLSYICLYKRLFNVDRLLKKELKVCGSEFHVLTHVCV